jgi:hypothetical protein
MNTAELINVLREVVKCYDLLNNGESSVIKELIHWREEFVSLHADPVKTAFKATNCEVMMQKGPQNVLNEVLEGVRKQKEEADAAAAQPAPEAASENQPA